MEKKSPSEKPEEPSPAQPARENCRIQSPILTSVLLGLESLVPRRRPQPVFELRRPHYPSTRAPERAPAQRHRDEEKVPPGRQQAPQGNRQNTSQPAMRFAGGATGTWTPVSGDTPVQPVVLRPAVLRPAPYPARTWFTGCCCCCCSYAAAIAARATSTVGLHYQGNLAQKMVVERLRRDVQNTYRDNQALCRALQVFEADILERDARFQELQARGEEQEAEEEEEELKEKEK
ncbi:uncharacterized protein LOC132591509 [Zootoca vivipara]|uniref:uncharacterized protein LOC132591509 n=1 Tax=Zootoca vivipara TaxID=8524 RepID=UPI00293BC99B|nr:uncharacterized protein LOC132591509 [Zootoca vivipara]